VPDALEQVDVENLYQFQRLQNRDIPIHDQQGVGVPVGDDGAVGRDERREQFGHFRRGNELQRNDLHDDPFSVACTSEIPAETGGYAAPGGVFQGADLIDVSFLDGGQSVDFQNLVENLEQIRFFEFSGRMDGHPSADAGIDDIIDLQQTRHGPDDFVEIRIVEIENKFIVVLAGIVRLRIRDVLRKNVCAALFFGRIRYETPAPG
jgi:hypothetical protein